jgi:hypothetical protein
MWNHKIKAVLTSAFLICAVLALSAGHPSGLAAPASAAGGCDLKTLQGAYGNSFQFLNTDPANAGAPMGVGTHTPGAGVGVLSFDGKGNFSGQSTISTGGLIIRPVLETGKYTVNADCTGSLDLTFAGLHAELDIVIVDNGNEVFTLSRGPGDIAIGRLRKQ